MAIKTGIMTINHSTDLEVLSKNKTKSILLTKIEISNGEDFTDQFFNKLLSPLLTNSDFTIDQLISESNKSFKNLSNTGVFKDVKINILEDDVDPTIQGTTTGTGIKPLPVKALISLTPRNLINTNITSVFHDDGNALGFKYENLNCFGNAESFLSFLQFDLRNDLKMVDLQFKSPLTASTRLFLNGILTNNVNKYASHKQILVNTMIGLENTSFFQIGRTYYQSALVGAVSMNKRTITGINDSASDIIKGNSGDSLKNSFNLSGSLDSRAYLSQESLFPVSGSFVSINNEISSSEGNFIKSTISTQHLYNFFNNSLIFKFDSNIGGIVSLSNKKIHLQDKFFQGGLTSLQGFQQNSIGVKDGNDYIGGDIFYNFKISTLYRLPFVSLDRPLRIVNFINFGDVFENLDSLKSKNYTNFNEFFIKQNSTNLGLGLVYKFGTDAHLNLNYNFPLSTRINDLAKPGLEFSLSLASDF